MNETPSTASADTAPTGGVSMRKPSARARREPKPPAAKVTPPMTINVVTGALIVMVLGGLARALLLLGNTAGLRQFVIYSNAHAKKPDKSFTESDITNAIHSVRSTSLIQAVLFGVVLALLAWSFRRSRSASGSRWVLLIIFVLTYLPFYVVPTPHLPIAPQVAGVIIGAASIVVLLFTFVPPASQRYFRECRDANLPEELRGQPRPGLSSLFGPKRGRGAPPARGGGLFGGGRATTRPAATRPAARASEPANRPASPAKAKAKVRSDSDAVAKGAELARSRAKASKSRRTAD